MQAQQERPPYVRFETRETEDREASISAGHYVGKDTIFALITPQGSRDTIERVALEWVNQSLDLAREGRLPNEWAMAYKQGYELFKEGREMPESGTPIMTWPGVGPAQQKAILNAQIKTVEDLAQANEAALQAIGIGARGLKEKAQAWLDVANDTGKVAEELAALRKRLEQADARNDDLAAKLEAFMAKAEKKAA